ncbi:MAG: hypothetical protein ACOZBH_04895 [Patescibacteria group bacterium]
MTKKIVSLAIAVSCVFLLAASCEVSTANLSDIKMCDNAQSLQCAQDVTEFTTTTPVIYCTAVLNNAPAGTTVTASWYYLDEELGGFIDSTTVESEEMTSDLQFSLTKPTNDWPTGPYKVELQINGQGLDIKEFSVK